MKGWNLTLIAPFQVDLDASSLSAVATSGDEREVCSITLISSRLGRSFVAGDLFKVRSGTDDHVTIQGDVRFLHQLGYGWTESTLRIEGDVGTGLGASMRSGCIEVFGNTMASAGWQMRGGDIRISGDTGDYLGGPLPGRRSGMSGGRIVVSGNAGHHAGHCMRRGTIVLLGDCGDGVGTDMVAGTIVAGGTVGKFVGAGMRRGTVFLAKAQEIDPVRFSPPRDVNLSFTRLIARGLDLVAPEIAAAMHRPMCRYLGDRSVGGQGEILVMRPKVAAQR